MNKYVDLINDKITKFLDETLYSATQPVHEAVPVTNAMRYSIVNGGKRLRPTGFPGKFILQYGTAHDAFVGQGGNTDSITPLLWGGAVQLAQFFSAGETKFLPVLQKAGTKRTAGREEQV